MVVFCRWSGPLVDENAHPVDLYVGQRLRKGRLARGLTQAELAARLNVSAQQVQKYEQGSNRVSASKLYEVANTLGKTVDWFFDGLAGEAPPQLAEPVAAYEAQPGIHDRTRALIAAFKALPDDAARAEVLTYVQGKIAPET